MSALNILPKFTLDFFGKSIHLSQLKKLSVLPESDEIEDYAPVKAAETKDFHQY